jgi:hypothetical protein
MTGDLKSCPGGSGAFQVWLMAMKGLKGGEWWIGRSLLKMGDPWLWCVGSNDWSQLTRMRRKNNQ